MFIVMNINKNPSRRQWRLREEGSEANSSGLKPKPSAHVRDDGPHVLLEAMAQGETAHRRTDQTRCSRISCDSDGVEPEELLASFENSIYELRIG
jgi:hypothetical protein